MMFQSILVVCIGNICRSPMAVALMQHEFAHAAHPPRIESAGLQALVGQPADPMARELMRERSIDLSGHVARQLTPELAMQFDLILTMDGQQVADVTAMAPILRGRVHRLGTWSDIDIPDPYRHSREAFEAALAGIDQGVNDWKRKLAG